MKTNHMKSEKLNAPAKNYNWKKKGWWTNILTVILLSSSFFTLPLPIQAQNNQKQEASDYEAALRKLYMAHLAVTSLYVDTVNVQKLTEDAINSMLKELDPHSSYTNAKETKSLNEPLQGNFEGIGVQYNMLEDTLVVIQPVSKGPSEKAGILAGDRIIAVDDTTIAGVKMSREEIMRRLKGPKGSIVELKVKRNGITDLLSFRVKRDKIPVSSLDAAYMVTPETGLIRISNFGAKTHEELAGALKKLQEQGIKNLILDLQQNGGGYLGAAIDIANEFLAKNDLIVYTQGRRTPYTEYRAKGSGRFLEGGLAVLVDEYTASAAEIVTGAIQDQDRGIVIGRRTFGKGLVQRPIDLPDGSMIRLTISRYYTPAGRCIQKPYEQGDKNSYNMDVINRYNHGELTNADSIHFPDSLKYTTLRKARTVYGGGGIMPDYFIPLDTTKYTKYHRELSAKGAILNTNLKYIDKARKKLQREYKSFAAFMKDYEVPQEELDLLYEEGKKMKVAPEDDAEREASLAQIKLQLKALTARDLWDMSEYFQIINENNESVRKAVELLEGKAN